MDEYASLLSELIAVPSVNPMGRSVTGSEFLETRLTEFLEAWLTPLDLEVRRQPVAEGRENLLATYHAPGASKHVLLEVHQDTVPVDGMTIEPFTPKIEGNRLYGRGACDNKGPMTAMLLALKRLTEEKSAGSASVTLALTVDEEHTFLGVRELVKQGIDAQVAVVAEPTDLNIVVAHKGVTRWVIETPGAACHSSTPEMGISAVYRMAPVLNVVKRHAEELSRRTPDPHLGRPTISVGRIEGGVSVNTVPDSCRIELDRRLVPGETPEAAHAALAKELEEETGVDFDVKCHPVWMSLLPMDADSNGPLTESFGRVIDAVHGNHRALSVAFGTDAASINASGVPSIVFGPGSIAKAHTEDEWVPLDEVRLASEIYYRFAAEAAF